MTHVENPTQTASPKLRCLPVQFVGLRDGVVLARGCTEVHISGEDAATIVEFVLAATAGEGSTREEIQEHFAAPDRPRIDNLVTELLKRRLLMPVNSSESPSPPPGAEETSMEVFYWHFGTTTAEIQTRLDERHIAIVGVNAISRQLAAALRAAGLSHLEVVDHPWLRNRRLFQEDQLRNDEWPAHLPQPLAYERWRDSSDLEALSCVVATADFGGQALLRSWNEFCVVNHCTFLPVVLDRFMGLVGPLVVPRETACYECLLARENANKEDYVLQRALEQPPLAVQRQAVSGFHPSMASILGDLAAIELHKFYSLALPVRVGVLLQVNLLQTGIVARKVLKLPRCPVCSPLNKRSGLNPDKISFLPGTYTPEPRDS
jgi:molybdopterin-synthase adenylyltransferase